MICNISLKVDCDHFVLTKCEEKALQRLSLYQEDLLISNSLENLGNVINKSISYWSQMESSCEAQPHLNKINTFQSEQITHVGNVSLEKGCDKQKQIISRILLGQALLKNNNIFSNELLADIQHKDKYLKPIIWDVQKGASNNCQNPNHNSTQP